MANIIDTDIYRQADGQTDRTVHMYTTGQLYIYV